MLKISEDTKIFVHCPAGAVTGGAELLHQLVDVLNRNGYNAYIVYYGSKPPVVPSDYSCYAIKVADIIEDEINNVEVLFEGHFDFAKNNHRIQKFLWWLSVDNFYLDSQSFLSPIDIFKFNKKLGIRSVFVHLKRIFEGASNKNKISLSYLRSLKAMNGYQSEYAQNFLQNNGFSEMVAMKDFINTEHISEYDISAKENIVVYNPKKGLKFTNKIIKSAPEIKWIPLQGMSRSDLIKTLKSAKVYIDFGYHPGKDRLPRECAMNGCCVITGKQGSAAFFEDVMIPDSYKFSNSNQSIDSIIRQIKWIFNNYGMALKDFEPYRNMILKEKEEFEKQVLNAFYINK